MLGACSALDNLDFVSSIDVARFREVLGHFVTGIAVVTADTPEGPVGFTCQTFGALSLEPSLISSQPCRPAIRGHGLVKLAWWA